MLLGNKSLVKALCKLLCGDDFAWVTVLIVLFSSVNRFRLTSLQVKK